MGEHVNSPLLNLLRPKLTGRILVSFKEGLEPKKQSEIVKRAIGSAGVASASSSDANVPTQGSNELFSDLLMRHGFAVVRTNEKSLENSVVHSLQEDENVETARPEFYLFSTEAPLETTERTWGIGATRVDLSPYTGKGIKIAVLDTGIDSGHPDFSSRKIVSKSFVPGDDTSDVKGHGTHCAGTAAAGKASSGGLRYGVAPGADLYVAKVLDDQGSGREADIIAALFWAIEQKCDIISMSLGRSVREDEEVTPEYEHVAKIALDAGSLIIAAAGNNSTRQFGFIAPVSEPANANSIMAVAALDLDLSVASFSNGSVYPNGGKIDIAAPGVGVISSVPRPRLYDRLSGTSMACPHVAGIAALWAESDPTLRGRDLWAKLQETAMTWDGADVDDVGAGLVQAPVANAPATS